MELTIATEKNLLSISLKTVDFSKIDFFSRASLRIISTIKKASRLMSLCSAETLTRCETSWQMMIGLSTAWLRFESDLTTSDDEFSDDIWANKFDDDTDDDKDEFEEADESEVFEDCDEKVRLCLLSDWLIEWLLGLR